MKHWCRMTSPLGNLLLVEEACCLLEISPRG